MNFGNSQKSGYFWENYSLQLRFPKNRVCHEFWEFPKIQVFLGTNYRVAATKSEGFPKNRVCHEFWEFPKIRVFLGMNYWRCSAEK